MAHDPQTWTFEQQGGDKKTLVLNGWSAPFGRPRRAPVVTDGIKIRQSTVRYPGNNGPPTRHLFGVMYKPWELSGRFMDREGGAGYAMAKAREVQDFVRDQQECLISWGDIINYVGFIDEFDPAREASSDVAWKMVVQIDDSNDQPPSQAIKQPPGFVDQIALLEEAASSLSQFEDLPNINPNVFDALSTIIGDIAAATGTLTSLANQISNLEQSTFGQLQRLRGALGQVKTAYLTLVNTMFALQQNSLTVRRSFSTDSQVGGLFASIDIQTLSALAVASQLDRQAAIAQRRSAQTTYTAQGGDSWESISIQKFGSPDQADALRQANGIRSGQRPFPGQRVQVPRT